MVPFPLPSTILQSEPCSDRFREPAPIAHVKTSSPAPSLPLLGKRKRDLEADDETKPSRIPMPPQSPQASFLPRHLTKDEDCPPSPSKRQKSNSGSAIPTFASLLGKATPPQQQGELAASLAALEKQHGQVYVPGGILLPFGFVSPSRMGEPTLLLSNSNIPLPAMAV